MKKEYNKKYYKENKDKLNEHSRIYNIEAKESISENKKQYYEENKERISKSRKEYYELNREKIKERKKLYKLNNKEKIALQKKNSQKKKLETNIGKLSHNIRAAIRRSLVGRGYNKKYSSEKILGCTIEEFKVYIEGLFEEWMTWENKGLYNGTENYGWDLDHIVPLSSAKTEEEVIKLNYYKNIQPLCSYNNRDVKKNKKTHSQ